MSRTHHQRTGAGEHIEAPVPRPLERVSVDIVAVAVVRFPLRGTSSQLAVSPNGSAPAFAADRHMNCRRASERVAEQAEAKV